MMNMGEKKKVINATLAKLIWKREHLKKVEFILWKIVHEVIGTNER